MFAKGDQVVERGTMSSVGTVLSGPEKHGGEDYYRVNFNGQIKNVLVEDLERYVGDLGAESLLLAGKFGGHEAFARRMTMSKLRRPLRDAVYSYKASRTDFHAYQFKPLLKFLSSDRRRLLIADEVGLGKTIEAAYILQEERARFGIERILVVCPSKLRAKWLNELLVRFSEEFDILDRSGFLQKAILRDAQKEQALHRLQAIVSLETVRGTKLIDAVEERGAPLDLLIVDEAHHCRNSETKQHRAIRALADLSEAVIFLTATPVHLGDQNLFNLLRLLVPEEFDRFDVFQDRINTNRWIVESENTLRRGGEQWRRRVLESLDRLRSSSEGSRFAANPLYQETMEMLGGNQELDRQNLLDVQENLAHLNLLTPIMTRTRKREVYPDAAKRDAKVIPVPLSLEEQQVYDRLSNYCFQRYSAHHGDFAARFALITLQRQLASSLRATLDHYQREIQAGDWNDDIDEDFGDSLVEPNDDENGASWTPLQEVEFRDLIVHCRSVLGDHDEKLKALLTLLRSQRKVVVFAYFKRSLRHLERALSNAGIGCVRIDGDVPANPFDPDNDERLRRIEQFRTDESIHVLLSSEVGSEGLDFQFCNVIVNWDLPWNPMVVEQRIGRVDRLGQLAEKILIFSFSCPGTIEDLILTRLYNRIGIFERTIGVLEPILGQEIRELTDQLLDSNLTQAERIELIEQKARALAKRVRDEQRLEDQSAHLVGHDEFFREQIERVRRLGRFVTGDELRLFVGRFLETEYPRSAFTGAADDQNTNKRRVYVIEVPPALRDFVRDPLPKTDPALFRFCQRATTGKLTVTFDHEEAMRDGRVELVSATHPLVRAIAKHYENKPALVHPVTSLQVHSDAVPAGEYLFIWASVEETGVREGRSLWTVVISVNGDTVPDEDASEMLIHHMVLRGTTWPEFETPPREMSAELFQRARNTLFARHQRYRQNALKRNAALVQQRLASLESSYRAKRVERERRLEVNRLRGNQRVIPLFEAQLRRLEAEFEDRSQAIRNQQNLSVSVSDPEGAGYVRVVG